MYHFVADPHTPELRLSTTEQVSSSTTQYLKSFQLDAVQKLYTDLNKYEFSILNDESGLGKSATTAALLSAIGPHKKTLIVLQNDDQQVAGWEFHLNLLAESLTVCVIQNSENTTDSDHNIYLAKWGVLRSIGDLSKLNFDYVIVDHRGFTLNNNFCTSMLFKHFEKRVNIVVSSIDITSDLKLLHNILRLGGRLEHKFLSFKRFEEKFYLADAKEVFSKKVDLEEYYRQREILGEFVKEYRLRRYRHQYDQYMPLVTLEQYKSNLTLWVGTHNSHTTISSQTTSSMNSTTNDVHSTASTEEIIECLMRIKHERQEAEHREPMRECTEILESSEEPISPMSPLYFETSESDDVTNEVVLLQTSQEEDEQRPEPEIKSMPKDNDDVVFVSSEELVEMVTPTRSTRRKGRHLMQSEPEKKNTRMRKNTDQEARLKTIVNMTKINEDEVMITPPKRTTRQMTEVTAASAPTTKRSALVNLESSPKTSKSRSPKEIKSRELNIAPKGVHNRKTRSMQRLTRSAEANRTRSKYMTKDLALIIDKKPTSSKKTRMPKKIKEEVTSPSSKTSNNSPKSAAPTPSPSKQQKKTPPNSRYKTKCDTPTPISTESFKRGNKSTEKKVNKTASAKDKKQAVVESQEVPLLLPSSSISEYEEIQCGQKLPSDLSLENHVDEVRFRMPSIPLSTMQTNLLPMSTTFLNDSDVTFVPATNQATDVVILLSSQDECSHTSSLTTTTATTKQSRRTRAFKRRKNESIEKPKKPLEISFERLSTSFGELLARHQSRNKSPDLFSNCSDVMTVIPGQQLRLTTPREKSPFEGFKIFGSEVKQFQQQHAKTQKVQQKEHNGASLPVHRKSNRDHSCLMVNEPLPNRRVTKESAINNNKPIVLPTLPTERSGGAQASKAALSQPKIRNLRVLLDDDDIFEITNNGEFGGRLRLNSNGDVSPVHQQTQATSTKATQNNKITNYLIGSGNSGNTPVEDSTVVELLSTPTNRTSSSTHRKSPKSLKVTQSTKLTRWFGSAAAERKNVATTPNVSGDSKSSENPRRPTRSQGPTKRKRLDLFK